MIEKFYKDLQKVYELVSKEQKDLQRFYDILDDKKSIIDITLIDLELMVDEFLTLLNIPINQESRVAAINRIVNLREDSLVMVMKEEDFSEEDIIKAKEKAYLWVADFYIKRFEKLIEKIEELKLLTPFYREILKGTHEIGKSMSSWQSSWTAEILNGTNRELFRLFNGDEEKIFELLNEKNLLDLGHEGKVGDRSYSVLRINNGKFVRVAYVDAFTEEVKEVVNNIEIFIDSLSKLKDEVFNQKRYWIEYLKKIKIALLEKDPDLLIKKWADVDRAWMKITTPIQLAHPLEYYEDHYRKAVALEWDVRIVNPEYKNDTILAYIESMFKKIYLKTKKDKREIFESSLNNLKKVQLYIGRPFSWYGAEFNGLFSAQVVPNDKKVSNEFGKKIFAYADMIYEAQKTKPLMKITEEIFEKDMLQKFKDILKNPKIWHEVYNITTIGHEFGHILWIDESSEALMNRSGQFKNVEEFKATTGGLLTFFMFEKEGLQDYILVENIQRSVSLTSWMQTVEVLPYYIEGLLHLTALFDTKILSFDKKLKVDLSKEKYERLKKWYMDVYLDLVSNFYLEKRDPKEFLEKFIKKENCLFFPKSRAVEEFVKHYWNLYKKIGRIIAD